MNDPKQELTALRERMDRVNDQLVDSLGEFYAIADAIGTVKDQLGMPHQDLAREARMKTRALLRNRGPLSSAALSELFNHILRLSVLRMDEGGKQRLSVGRPRGAADRIVTMAGLHLGDGTALLGIEDAAGLALGPPGDPRAAVVRDLRDVRDPAAPADGIRIRAARMYDYRLLAAAGRGSQPVILERNRGATVSEWLHCAEYIAAEGNDAIVLCEAGSLSFGGTSRPTLDLSAVALARTSSVLPVLVRLGDGPREDCTVLAAAAVAAGACGVVVSGDSGFGEDELAALGAAISGARPAGSPGP